MGISLHTRGQLADEAPVKDLRKLERDFSRALDVLLALDGDLKSLGLRNVDSLNDAELIRVSEDILAEARRRNRI